MRGERGEGVFLVLLLLSRAGGEPGSWLSWSLTQAREASREASTALYRGVKDLACQRLECCNQDWRPGNFSRLEADLKSHLVGQHLAQDLVVRAVRGHQNNDKPSKPLVLSFHGWTGSGKNFVSQFVAESLYRRGLTSSYVHLLIATLHFPDPAQSEQYKVRSLPGVRTEDYGCRLDTVT